MLKWNEDASLLAWSLELCGTAVPITSDLRGSSAFDAQRLCKTQLHSLPPISRVTILEPQIVIPPCWLHKWTFNRNDDLWRNTFISLPRTKRKIKHVNPSRQDYKTEAKWNQTDKSRRIKSQSNPTSANLLLQEHFKVSHSVFSLKWRIFQLLRIPVLHPFQAQSKDSTIQAFQTLTIHGSFRLKKLSNETSNIFLLSIFNL